jgi:hypothetical protein
MGHLNLMSNLIQLTTQRSGAMKKTILQRDLRDSWISGVSFRWIAIQMSNLIVKSFSSFFVRLFFICFVWKYVSMLPELSTILPDPSMKCNDARDEFDTPVNYWMCGRIRHRG